MISKYLAITGTSVTVDLGRFYVTQPIVFVCINGAPTEVSWVAETQTHPILGEVYYRVVFTFDVSAVGNNFTVIVDGNEAQT